MAKRKKSLEPSTPSRPLIINQRTLANNVDILLCNEGTLCVVSSDSVDSRYMPEETIFKRKFYTLSRGYDQFCKITAQEFPKDTNMTLNMLLRYFK